MGRRQDRAYGLLHRQLVDGYYRPGFHLREEPLARAFGLSRTPIRAALRRLVEDGLATDAGHGIHVAEWSESDIAETFRLRMLLEPHATELAVQRGGAALVEHLEAGNAAMAKAIAENDEESIGTAQEASRDFHHALIAFSGSPRLQSMLTTLIDVPVMAWSFLYSLTELKQSVHHHRDITFAACVGDGDLGRRAMQLHLRMTYARALEHRASRSRGSAAGER
ncbi:GntR family transcriptional regulator [Methylobacterium nonmethylotrophicum]|uniref:GntR family transcriptional regulator n=1 Tax=Methylobacterium nonmethylotrophicum TaxID=1141884 RepID=A0A4Z0NMH8_9HYPH|nr:GntR family transcriptional regulator [Methylobacterium nonmethylotrophicum]TGD97769.1 GntR family transcriptional regulator [Methylobacterium nonmethylotrophicum]